MYIPVQDIVPKHHEALNKKVVEIDGVHHCPLDEYHKEEQAIFDEAHERANRLHKVRSVAIDEGLPNDGLKHFNDNVLKPACEGKAIKLINF